MTLTNTKIVFILLLTTSLSLSACSSMDDEDSSPAINDDKALTELLAGNCIVLPGNSDPSNGLDTLSNDTLKIFPDDAAFHKLLMQCLLSSQGMVQIITRSIDASVFTNGGNSWMSYYEPYLGVYSSFNDSRSKQWNLEQDVFYEGKTWNYHLSILDLPEGVSIDKKGERAVEVFYDSDFRHGMMTFSPTDFDAVRFPKKIFGPDIRGTFTFIRESGITANELYLTNIGVNNNVKYIRNVYLRTESFDNGYVSIKAMIDFPALWFDNRSNSGFTVSVVGAYDITTHGAVLYSGIVRNSSNEKSVNSLVLEHPSDEVLGYYYPLWQNMMAKSENNFSPEAPGDNNETDSNQESDDNEDNGNTGDNQKIGSVVMSVGSKDAGTAVVEGEVEYGKPGFYMNGEYVPASAVSDKTPYLKALNKCLDMMDDDFPISPYKNSVNQVEWMVVEKSR